MKDLPEFDLSGSDLVNFRSRVVNHCNDNEDFFAVAEDGGCVEYDDADLDEVSGDEYASAALEHYNASAEARGDDVLDGRHAEQFKRTAKQLHEEGLVPHAGALIR